MWVISHAGIVRQPLLDGVFERVVVRRLYGRLGQRFRISRLLHLLAHRLAVDLEFLRNGTNAPSFGN